jgi:hypothetical protein
MFERGIKESHVSKVIAEGELIAEYPDDEPFPSMLLMAGWTKKPSMLF